MTDEFKKGFVVGIVVSLLLIAFYNTASADDQYVVLHSEPVTEGTEEPLKYLIMNTHGGECYIYVPSSTLHPMVLKVVECPL